MHKHDLCQRLLGGLDVFPNPVVARPIPNKPGNMKMTLKGDGTACTHLLQLAQQTR